MWDYLNTHYPFVISLYENIAKFYCLRTLYLIQLINFELESNLTISKKFLNFSASNNIFLAMKN